MPPTIQQRPITTNPVNTEALAPTSTQALTGGSPTEALPTATNHNAKQFGQVASYANNTRGVFGANASAFALNRLNTEAAQICDRAVEYIPLDTTPPDNLRSACDLALRRNV